MPYAPGEHFDPSLIFRGPAMAGEAIGGGIADMLKKQKEAEAQAAGSLIQFQTLKNAGLLSPEEETMFHNGNANKKAAIVTSATPRLLEKFRTQKEQNDMQQAAMQRALQLKIAEMHYGADGAGDGMTPYQREQTRLREMDIQRKAQKSSIPLYSRAIARGKLDAAGNFTNNYAEAAQGDMTQVRTPDGKTLVVPWDAYIHSQQAQAATGAQPYQPDPGSEQVIPSTDYGPSVPPLAVTAPHTAIIAKNGHHYEVDHASKKVIRQID